MFGCVGKHDPDTDSSSSEDENNVTVVEQKPKRKTITEEDLMEIEVKREGTSPVWSAPQPVISYQGTINGYTYSTSLYVLSNRQYNVLYSYFLSS